MKIPSDPEKKKALYQELVRRCAVSRGDRAAKYARRRLWYLTGSEGPTSARFNKLDSFIDTLTGYLYAQETTRFSLRVPAGSQRTALGPQAETGRDVFMEKWHDADCDRVFGEALRWALVYDSTIIKVLAPQAGVARLGTIEPQQFGVLREDVAELDEQEAAAHWYAISLPEVERLLDKHPQKETLLAKYEAEATSPKPESDAMTLPPAMSRIVMTAVSPTMTGTASMAASAAPIAQVDEPTLEFCELWVWDDDANDYRAATLDPQDEVIWDPVNPSKLAQDMPFVTVTPYPDLSYLWGTSILESLIELQAWRARRMDQIDDLLKRQLNPPRSFLGMSGVTQEKALALNRANGYFTFGGASMPNAKIETHAPQMPPDAFAEIKAIDEMFAEAGGIPLLLQGQNDPGLRAGGHASVLATIASSRIRKRALIIEDQLEQVATKMFRLLRLSDAESYDTPDGQSFTLGQLPSATTVKVNAHSSSPLYAEQVVAKADRLIKAGAIDLEAYVELVDPPMADFYKAKARELQKMRAQMAEQKLAIEKMKAERRGR